MIKKKTLNHLEIEGDIWELIKGIFIKPTANSF